MLMPRPRIVKETRREVLETPPPSGSRLRVHPWLTPDTASASDSIRLARGLFDVYISVGAESKIRKHATEYAEERLEVMGFLIGDVRKWQGRTYTVVRNSVTTALRSTPSRVRFDPEAYPKLFHELDSSGFDYVVVGWYHSHPGHTCFLSKTDLATQRSSFDQPYHVALVVDPVNEEIKTFRLSKNSYEETAFALYTGVHPGANRRKRKLKARPIART